MTSHQFTQLGLSTPEIQRLAMNLVARHCPEFQGREIDYPDIDAGKGALIDLIRQR